MTTTRIHPDTTLGAVALTVANLDRSLAFYQDIIGLQIHAENGDTVHLGAGKDDLVVLTENKKASPVRMGRGLYHYAILVPSRYELAKSLVRFIETETPLQGASDHFVSEAIYLADPDGTGIEIYRDLPRSEWTYPGGTLNIGTVAMDTQGVLDEYRANPTEWTGLHPDTQMGHMHLHVTNIAEGEHFYNELMGFDPVINLGGFMSFLSAGGYHHHIGIRQGMRAAPDALGLRWYTIQLPTTAALDGLVKGLRAANIEVRDEADGVYLHDPAGNGIRLIA